MVEVVSQPTTCLADNTFTVDLDARQAPSGESLTLRVSYGLDSVEASVPQNTITRLSIDVASLSPVNLSTAASYSVTGECDSSLGEVVNLDVEEDVTLTAQSLCHADNSFSMDIDVSRLTVSTVTFRVRYGDETISHPVTNDMVSLSIDVADLLDLDSSTAASYNVTGSCDPSLEASMGQVSVSIGNPVVSGMASCLVTKDFSIDLDASGVVSEEALIRVSYGGISIHTTVTNDILRLRVDSPVPLTSSNETSYTLTGKCDLSLTGDVTAEVVETSAIGTLPCSSDTFSVSVDASSVTTNPVVIRVSHGDQLVSVEVSNELVPLEINQGALSLLNLSTASSYVVTGSCDDTVTGNVTVTATETDGSQTGSPVTGDVACASGSFSVTLDLGSVALDFVDLSASHGSHSSQVRLENQIIPLNIHTLTVPLNLSTASSYGVSGDCDATGSGLGNGLVTVSVGGTAISEDVACGSDNLFTADLDVSSVDPSSTPNVTFQADFVGATATESIANSIILLNITSSGNLTNSNKASYSVSGDCDPSLGEVTVVMGTPLTAEVFAVCDTNNNDFSASVDATDVIDDPATITVTQGQSQSQSQGQDQGQGRQGQGSEPDTQTVYKRRIHKRPDTQTPDTQTSDTQVPDTQMMVTQTPVRIH